MFSVDVSGPALTVDVFHELSATLGSFNSPGRCVLLRPYCAFRQVNENDYAPASTAFIITTILYDRIPQSRLTASPRRTGPTIRFSRRYRHYNRQITRPRGIPIHTVYRVCYNTLRARARRCTRNGGGRRQWPPLRAGSSSRRGKYNIVITKSSEY